MYDLESARSQLLKATIRRDMAWFSLSHFTKGAESKHDQIAKQRRTANNQEFRRDTGSVLSSDDRTLFPKASARPAPSQDATPSVGSPVGKGYPQVETHCQTSPHDGASVLSGVPSKGAWEGCVKSKQNLY